MAGKWQMIENRSTLRVFIAVNLWDCDAAKNRSTRGRTETIPNERVSLFSKVCEMMT